MYAAVRQGKARAGMAEELAVRIKGGAIPIISAYSTAEAAAGETGSQTSSRNDVAGRAQS